MGRVPAVVIHGKGGVECLSLGETDVRAPGPREVLVDVAASGLNRADILQRRGFYPAPSGVVADVPGLEYAGTIAAIGGAASAFECGDRVMGIAAGGAMAAQIVAHERELLTVPAAMDLNHAAAIPEVFLTAFDGLFSQGELRMGNAVLLHAIASGIGTAALQLALAAGASVVGTTRTDSKLTRCGELGLEHGIVVSDGQFAKEVKARIGRGVDVVLDTIGAAYLEQNVRVLAPRGRIVVVGLLGGATGEVPLALLLAKRASIIGTVLRGRPLEEKVALIQRFAVEVLPRFSDGTMVPVVDTVMPIADVAAAHQRMERSENVGKIVLAW